MKRRKPRRWIERLEIWSRSKAHAAHLSDIGLERYIDERWYELTEDELAHSVLFNYGQELKAPVVEDTVVTCIVEECA